jgi:hypothetical protein
MKLKIIFSHNIMNNDVSPLILLMDKSKERKPTKKQIMKKVFIMKDKKKK